MMRKFWTGTARTTFPLIAMTAANPSNGGTFNVDNATGWPTQGSFVLVVGRGLASEEKMLISQRNGSTFFLDAVFGRGFDGTTPVAHPVTESVELCLDADTMNDIEAHIYDPTRDDHTQYLTLERLRTAGITPSIPPGSLTRSLLDLSLMPIINCTSATLPGNPQLGQVVFETDNNLFYYWDGAWAALPGQRLGGITLGSSTALATGLHDIPGLTASFSMPALVGQRRVKVTMAVHNPYAATGGTLHDVVVFTITRGDTAVLGTKSVVYHNVFGTTYGDTPEFSCELTNSDFIAGATAVVKGRVNCPTAATGAGVGSFLRVEVI